MSTVTNTRRPQSVAGKRWNRVLPGVPTGGEFATRTRPEGMVNLAPGPGGITQAERDLRHAALVHGGFVPAIAGPRMPAAENAKDAGAWWDTEFVRAEHQGEAGGYPKLPDDYTPKRSGGRALSGSRRTHRIRYEGAGVSLRMPSATAIKSFASDVNNNTFDVPVAADYPGGTVQGWVRVTRNGPGEWSVSGLGMNDKANAYVSEAVSAVLEARAPSIALPMMPDLMERRRERFAMGGVKISKTEKSGFISGVGYNPASGSMAVKIGNKHYTYKVSQEVFNRVRGARSPGQAYNMLVKGHEHAEEVTSCEKCGRFSAVSQGHRCPSSHKQPTSAPKPQNKKIRERARNARV